MRQVVSLSGTAFVLLYIVPVLLAVPVGEQYEPGPVNDPKGVMPETVVVDKVPKTGGPPYIVLSAVALLSVALIAGRAILRP